MPLQNHTAIKPDPASWRNIISIYACRGNLNRRKEISMQFSVERLQISFKTRSPAVQNESRERIHEYIHATRTVVFMFSCYLERRKKFVFPSSFLTFYCWLHRALVLNMKIAPHL